MTDMQQFFLAGIPLNTGFHIAQKITSSCDA